MFGWRKTYCTNSTLFSAWKGWIDLITCKSKQFLLFYISLSSVTKCPCPPACSGSKRVLKGAAQSAEVWIGLCYTAPTIHLLPIDDREGQGDLGSDRGQNRTFCPMYTSMYIVQGIGHSTMWPPDEVCMRTPAFQKALRVHMLRKGSCQKRFSGFCPLRGGENPSFFTLIFR